MGITLALLRPSACKCAASHSAARLDVAGVGRVAAQAGDAEKFMKLMSKSLRMVARIFARRLTAARSPSPAG